MNDLLSQSQDYLNAETIQMLGSYVLSIVAFVLILVVGRYVATKVRDVIRGGLDKPKVDTTLTKFAGNFAYYAIFLLAIFAGGGPRPAGHPRQLCCRHHAADLPAL
jgi:small conductance mechanosensitive channel